LGPHRLLFVAAYATLGVALLLSRLVALGHSFWHDEVLSVENFVRAGPHAILTGPALAHQLFVLLAWMTSTVTGESEIAFRLWSAVPFIAGVALVTAWLHVRSRPLSGVLFLFLATTSPLLLDITRQARGYGLAFFAMCVVIVSVLEADRSRRKWTIVTFCAGGLIGTWTLPQFGIAFVATGAVLLLYPELRRWTLLGLGVPLLAIAVWYVPHLDGVRAAVHFEDGIKIDPAWIVTAPIDQTLLPAYLWIDGTALLAGFVWLPAIVVAAIIMGASPLLHSRGTALLLSSGVVATVVVLCVARASVVPRYLSYLLVPLLVLVATGMAAILERSNTRPALLRTVASLVVIGLLAVRFVITAPDVVRLPREAYKDVAAIIDREGPLTVFAYVRNREGLEYYLDRPVQQLQQADAVAASVCERHETVAYVMQPYALRPAAVPCLGRIGVRHYRFAQYARGDEMNLWLVPPVGG
jgi:hypothetical protein